MRIRTTTVISTDARNGRAGLLSATVEELPDDGGDGAVRASTAEVVREVVEEHDFLSLDDEGDRELLIARLLAALEG